ncbi:MAG TPA: hypothetical protein VMV51_02245 [Gemmatimonadaceae bacterium]|nr:hypothetical protein [Gemmatimonadaceae bacterium]
MTRRLAAFAMAVTAVTLSCRAIPAPTNGVLSLSTVQLPSPGVAVGDTLRDSTGRIAPLRVYAFGVGGEADTIQGAAATAQFVLLDRGASVTSDGYVIGDSARTTPVRIIGSVGTLQTSVANLAVTPRPDSIGPTGATTIATINFAATDTTARSAALGATVLATGVVPAAGVQAVIVRYTIVSAPPGFNDAVTGILLNAAGRPATVDTTDPSGHVSPTIRLRPAALAAPSVPDSFVVTASASYAGVPLRGSPVRFVVPIQTKAPSGSRIH